MSQVEISIREACAEDSRGIAAILHALGWSAAIKQETQEQTQARIAVSIEQCRGEKTHSILVAEDKQRNAAEPVVGYVSVHWFPNLTHSGSEGYISELFILSSCRGQGVGSRLLDTVTVYARDRQCIRLLLMNRRIRESYQRGFYAKRGWQETPDGAFFSLILQNS